MLQQQLEIERLAAVVVLAMSIVYQPQRSAISKTLYSPAELLLTHAWSRYISGLTHCINMGKDTVGQVAVLHGNPSAPNLPYVEVSAARAVFSPSRPSLSSSMGSAPQQPSTLTTPPLLPLRPFLSNNAAANVFREQQPLLAAPAAQQPRQRHTQPVAVSAAAAGAAAAAAVAAVAAAAAAAAAQAKKDALNERKRTWLQSKRLTSTDEQK